MQLEPQPMARPPQASESEHQPASTTSPARWRIGVALRERLPLWVQLRCGLEPRALAALVVVLLVAAGFAGHHFWGGRPAAVPAPELLRDSTAAAQAPAPAPGSPTGPGSPAVGRIVVDVSGKVRRPGVLRLPAGSRVADALTAAGGVKADADTTGLNRARVLIDGEQVVVGVPLPPLMTGAPPRTGYPAGPGLDAPAGGRSGGSDARGAQISGVLSLNAATEDDLDTLPGVGPVLAQHIVDYRTENGGFRSVDQLREVDGIGDRRFADLEPLVRP
ncbi:helix-hairpin-helix domain-containing protein [Streptomyces albipurpureus]